MVLLDEYKLEYIGEETTLEFDFDNAFANGDITPFYSKRMTKLNYLLNPFQSIQQLSFIGHRIIIRSEGKKATVPNKQGLLRDKFTKITLYKGEFNSGFRAGTGICTIFNASQEYVGEYRGLWVNSMRHGYGEFETASGNIFNGEWKFDQKNGVGMEIDALGSKYIGTYQDDERHGSGRFIWGDGTSEDREYCRGHLVSKVTNDKEKSWDKFAAVQKQIEEWKKGTVITVVSDDPPPLPKPVAGLSAKREAKAFQDSLPKYNQEISKICGFPVQLEADWDSFVATDRASVCVWMLTHKDGLYSLVAISKALASICQDPLGKEGLKSKLKKILLKNRDKARELNVSLAGGTMEISDNFGYEDSKLEASNLHKRIEKLI